MSENNVKIICNRDDLVAIADAVRRKTNKTEDMTLSEITTNIDSISSDATATANDILSGKTAFVRGQTVTGTIAFAPARTITPSTISQVAISSGYYASGNITVAAVQTQSKTATPTSLSQNVIPDNGKFLSQVTVVGDANLVASNIKKGTTIFGVPGNYEGSGIGGTDYSVEDAFLTGTIFTYSNDRITNIRENAFANCTSLTSINFPVCTNIGSNAFETCTSLTSINFPVCTTIGNYAFYYCLKLTSINFPVCTSIGSNAFGRCSNLTSINFPVCTSIGEYAFHDCSNLTSINFSVCTNIGEYAFHNCSNLTSINFSVCTSIGQSAFYNCSSLTSVNFPSCTTIGSYAFYNCSSLTSVNFPSCTTIEKNAFGHCFNLTSVNFPVCKNIGSNAFAYCSSLTSINFPECIRIGSSAFYSCYSLASINFPSCTIIEGSAFYYCLKLTSINFPVCTTIGSYTFYNCSSLTSINFPVCTTIGSYAFGRSPSLTSVDVGVPVKNLSNAMIYWAAFSSCYKLSKLILRYSFVAQLSNINAFHSTPISNYTIYNNDSFGSIYVPASLVDAYKSATNWVTYANRIFSIEDSVVGEDIKIIAIEAEYNGGNVTVGTSPSDLRENIVVTAHYSDNHSEVVTDYELSGNILEGNNIVSISYDNMNTTITVVGGDRSIIEFSINNIPYQAQDGMTWEEWVNSDFNTGGFIIQSTFIYLGSKVVYKTGREETSNDIIIENTAYTLIMGAPPRPPM